MTSGPDHGFAFLAAAVVPALLTALYFLAWGGPLLFLIAFLAALFVTFLHVGLLAAPLYLLLDHFGPPGRGIVLLASILIGALPLPLLLGASDPLGAAPLLGMLGLSGGIAFVVVREWPGAREDFGDAP
ncbi:MAG TPA: hypothetical protein VMS43_09545 [Allosphingosinicella sp.]|nr:hypothetical protein [Allosphingosinicella sp.]